MTNARRLAFLSLGAVGLAVLGGACSQTGSQASDDSVPRGHVRVVKTGSQVGAVVFFHRRHKKHALEHDTCKTCHHAGSWGDNCGEAGCHADPVLDADGDRLHRGCIDRCHRVAGNDAPTDCGEGGCHDESD